MAPYQWFAKWEQSPWKKRGNEYEAFKARLCERLLEPLYAHCPQLVGKIDHIELSTPLSTLHFTAHPQGANLRPGRHARPFSRAAAASADFHSQSLPHRRRRLHARRRRRVDGRTLDGIRYSGPQSQSTRRPRRRSRESSASWRPSKQIREIQAATRDDALKRQHRSSCRLAHLAACWKHDPAVCQNSDR